jgi:predicted membrane protein
MWFLRSRLETHFGFSFFLILVLPNLCSLVDSFAGIILEIFSYLALIGRLLFFFSFAHTFHCYTCFYFLLLLNVNHDKGNDKKKSNRKKFRNS